MKFRRGDVAAIALVLFAAACATETTQNTVSLPPNAGVYKVGNPYQIEGTWYYPREQPDYDETGIASWYGPSFYGQRTANGERFDAEAITAAHRTLPMPVNVRVTNLDNGRSLVVRINDRGPFAKGRIIDVSEHAAKLLGFYGQGTARVRVTYVSQAPLPNGQMPSATPIEVATAVPAAPAGVVDVGTLSSSSPSSSDAAAPPAQLPVQPPANMQQPAAPAAEDIVPPNQPTGQVTSVPVPKVTHLYVQVGAFSIYHDALRIQERLGNGLQISTIERNRQKLYRVRAGPFDQLNEADRTLAVLMSLGSNDARILVDQ